MQGLAAFDTGALQIFFADARQLAAHGIDFEASGLELYLKESGYDGPASDVECALFVSRSKGGAVFDSAGRCHGSYCSATPLSKPGFADVVSALVEKGALSGLVYEGREGVVVGLGFSPGAAASHLLVSWHDPANLWPEATSQLAEAAAESGDLSLSEVAVDPILNGAIGEWESFDVTPLTPFDLAQHASSLTNPIHAT